MLPPLNLDALAQAQVERIIASLTLGSGVAIAGWLALRFASRMTAAARYATSLLLMLAVVLVAFRSAAPTISVAQAAHGVAVPAQWARYIFWIWIAIAGVGLLRVGAGLFRLRKLRAASQAVPAEHLPEAVHAVVLNTRRFGRMVSIRSSDAISVPAAIGFLHPAIMLPAWMLATDGVAADDLRQVVLHEAAHLERWDDWANLVQKLVRALFFFHPAVWWLDARIGAEREMACDDAVLRSTGDARAYARCLAHLAEKRYLRRTLIRTAALAQAAVGHLRLTSARVERILAGPSAASRWRTAAAATALSAIALFASLAHPPELITFVGPHVTEAANTPTLAKSARVGQPGVVLAAAHEQTPNLVLAKTPTLAKPARVGYPARPRYARRTGETPVPTLASLVTPDGTATGAVLVVIEDRQQFATFDGIVQVQTLRVVLVSAPTDGRKLPHQEI